MAEKAKIWTDAQLAKIAFDTKTKEYRIDAGLYLSVSPKTSSAPTKTWWVRWKSPITGKQTRQKIGIYAPGMKNLHIPLADARNKANEILLAGRTGENIKKIPTFCEIVPDWKEKYRAEVRKSTFKNNMSRLKLYIENSDIWGKKINEIEKSDIAAIIRMAPPEVGKKLLTLFVHIFSFAEALGFVQETDLLVPTASKIIPRRKVQHLPAIVDLDRFRALLRAIKTDYLEQSDIISASNMFLAYCFPRPIEMRILRWKYVDWDKRQINVPAEFVKTNRALVIPMSQQVEKMLKSLLEKRENDKRTLFSENEYIFHIEQSLYQPIWDTYMGTRREQLEFSTKEHCSHGFRSSASTFLREPLREREEAIEMQLDHSTGTAVSRIYNRNDYLDERREMLQRWADWVDEQAEEAKKKERGEKKPGKNK